MGELDELAAIPLLDLVSRIHHEALKKRLAQAEKLRPDSGEKAAALIEMISQRGEHFEMSVSAVPVEFDGEQCVQITLRTRRRRRPLLAFLKGRPWALYFSVAFLVLFATLPPLLLTKLNINNAAPRLFPARTSRR